MRTFHHLRCAPRADSIKPIKIKYVRAGTRINSIVLGSSFQTRHRIVAAPSEVFLLHRPFNKGIRSSSVHHIPNHRLPIARWSTRRGFVRMRRFSQPSNQIAGQSQEVEEISRGSNIDASPLLKGGLREKLVCPISLPSAIILYHLILTSLFLPGSKERDAA